MATFYLTKDGSNEHNPVLINLDKILTIAPLVDVDDYTTVFMDNGTHYAINEKFEDFIKHVPRYIPFVDFSDGSDSTWLRNYIDGLPKGASLC